MEDPVKTEWRRLLRRLRSKGASETTKYVSNLLRKGNYPVWYPYRLIEYLMKHDEFDLAGRLLDVTREYGMPHPLIDKLYGMWLWSVGKREAAIKFVGRKARSWPCSYLYSDLSTMYRLMGKKVAAKKYLQTADTLAKRELRAERKTRNVDVR